MEAQTPWMGEYVWEENKCDGSEPHCVPLPDEVIAMFRPSKCLLCGTVTNNQQSAFTHYESKGHFKKVAQHMREKYNVLGTLKSKETFRPVRCEVCQIDIMSRIVLMQHYEGKQHLKNLKKKSDGAAGTEVRDVADAPTTPGGGDFENPLDFLKDLPPPPPLPKLGIYFCSLCQMKTKSKAQMEIHNNGSRHLKNLSKLADGELKEFFLRNGNCEPVEAEGQDSTPPSTPASDGQVNPFPQPGGPPVGGYGYPPMGMPMMSPSSYPPMPYGQYPQYPMGYDYNSWNQGQQGYNAGPPPYNAQQQYGQMYNSGPYPYPYNQQQYNANQQQYPNNQQQYPGNQPPFLSGPPAYVPPQTFNDPCPAAPGTTDTPVSMGDDTFSTPNTSVKSRTPPKDPDDDDFEIKPLAVSNFIPHLAQETKLDNEGSNNPSPNPPVPVSTTDSGIIRNAAEGDSANPAAEVEYSPGQLDDSAKSDVESVGIEGAVYPTAIADNGGDVTTAADVGEIHKQGGANDTYKLDGASKSSSYSEGSEEEESANSSNKIKDESDPTPKSPSDEIREHKSDQNEHGQFVATGFTETNVQVSLDFPAENASSTTTDAFKFKMSVNTVGKPKVNSFFRRSSEKMFKEAKEKKRLEELQKLKESYNEAPSAECSTDVRRNVGAKTFDMSDNSHPIPEPIEYIPKNPEKQKFDKSDGEISDDVSAVLSSGQPQDSSVPKVSDSANSLGDNVDGQEKDKKDCDKNEQVQNDTKINSEKPKPSKKKFSASDKKKVSRTRNSSSNESKKSRSRSRSRRRRSGKRRSSSWNPSSEDESKNDYHGKSDYVQDNYYSYNNRNRNWRNNRGYYNNRGFHHRNYWDHQRYSWDNQEDYYERDVEETDEFGREKRRREGKKKDKRESRKRKKEKRSSSVVSFSSRSSSGSRSRSRKARRKSDKKEKSKKKPLPSPDVTTKKAIKTPETPVEQLISNVSQADTKQTPLTLAQKLRLDKSDRIRERDLEEKKELNAEAIVEDDSVSTANPVRLVAKAMPPEREELDQVVANKKELHQKPNIPSEFLQVLEKEREKQEILKKMALIKMKLEQKEKDKSVKKKKKKDKSKKKKKKRSSSTSSSSSSSSSSSDSSSSSNSSSSSSQNESLAEKLLAKMKKEAKGPGPSSVLPDLAKVLPLLKKNEPEASSKKKKRKKDKKAKKKKKGKSHKDEPSPSTLAAYVTPSGTYYCKYCNSSFVTGNSFIEHFLSQKHKLMYKLVKEKA